MSLEVTRQRLELGLGLGLGLGYQVNKILHVTVPASKRLPGLSGSVLVPTASGSDSTPRLCESGAAVC